MTRTVGTIARKAAQFIALRGEEKQVKERKETLRDSIKQWMQNNAEVDHDGHQWFELPEPMTIGKETFTHLKNEKKVSTFINEQRLVELAQSKDVEDRVVKWQMVMMVDQDEIYVLNQEGIISDEELDSLFDENVVYALRPVA